MKQNSTNAVVCRVQGEWNGALEFSYTSGEMRVVDVTKLPVTRKSVRPIEKQGPTESRSAGVVHWSTNPNQSSEVCANPRQSLAGGF